MKNLFKRGGQATGNDSVNLANATEELQRVLSVRWWRWRHLFLEAKRLEVEHRRSES